MVTVVVVVVVVIPLGPDDGRLAPSAGCVQPFFPLHSFILLHPSSFLPSPLFNSHPSSWLTRLCKSFLASSLSFLPSLDNPHLHLLTSSHLPRHRQLLYNPSPMLEDSGQWSPRASVACEMPGNCGSRELRLIPAHSRRQEL